MSKPIRIGNEEYEAVSKQGAVLSGMLVYAWEKLGKPHNPLSTNGKKLVEVIISAYADSYPREWSEWLEERKEYQTNELSIHEQVRHETGRSLASYPLMIYYILKTLFPLVDFKERAFCMKFVKEFPMFRMANKV